MNKFFDWIKGKSRFQKINGVDANNFHRRSSYDGGYGGHSADTWLNDIADYFRSLGIKVTVIK